MTQAKSKVMSLWKRADAHAGRSIAHAKHVMETPTGLWEYLRFSYMAGWAACARRNRYTKNRSVKP